MSKSVFEKPYAVAEYNIQAVNTHTAQVNNVAFHTDGFNIDMFLKGDIFRKTNTVASGVNMLVELFELNVAPTGGSAYNKYFGVPKNRDDLLLQDYITVLENVTYTPNPSGIMLRERSVADKSAVDRSGDLGLKYSLKNNTWYIFVSTVTDGVDYNVESTIVGEIYLLKKEV